MYHLLRCAGKDGREMELSSVYSEIYSLLQCAPVSTHCKACHTSFALCVLRFSGLMLSFLIWKFDYPHLVQDIRTPKTPTRLLWAGAD